MHYGTKCDTHYFRLTAAVLTPCHGLLIFVESEGQDKAWRLAGQVQHLRPSNYIAID